MSDERAQVFRGRIAAEAMEAAKAALGEDAVLLGQRSVVELTATSSSMDGATTCFYGGTRDQALEAMRSELGPDAVLVADRPMVELTAAPAHRGAGASGTGAARLLSRVYGAAASGGGVSPSQPGPREEAPWSAMGAEVLEDIQARLEEIERLARCTDRPEVPQPLLDYYLRLVDNEVSEQVARHLVERLSHEIAPASLADREAVREAMLQAIAKLIPAAGPTRLRGDGRPTVVVVVGPTGVGKTTSITKLAMQFKMQHRCRVGLISEDRHRPGGSEQLRSVAQLLNVPLVVADTVDNVRAALRRAGDRDVILVDTAGRVPRNEASLRELAAFLDAIEPDEVHLALCSLSGAKQILDTVRRFDAVRFDHIMLTKLDEAVTHGLILNVAANVDRSLSYVTTGQDYMEHIEPGDPMRLAGLVLGQDEAAAGRAPDEPDGDGPNRDEDARA